METSINRDHGFSLTLYEYHHFLLFAANPILKSNLQQNNGPGIIPCSGDPNHPLAGKDLTFVIPVHRGCLTVSSIGAYDKVLTEKIMFGQKGLMANATIKGAKFTKLVR